MRESRTVPVGYLRTLAILVLRGDRSRFGAATEQAMTILKNMSQYLAHAERFSVTIREGYDAVQQSGHVARSYGLKSSQFLRAQVLHADLQAAILLTIL